MTDPPQPSKDPGDVMGDDEHRPDAPTEPPDKPLDEEVEGARVECLEVERAETGVSEVSGVLRGSAEGTGDDGVKTHRPADPDEPHDKVEGARVEAVETAMSKALRGVQEDPGRVVDEDCRPGMPDEPPDKPYGVPCDPDRVQVEPGGISKS